jgi:hypothetical protein
MYYAHATMYLRMSYENNAGILLVFALLHRVAIPVHKLNTMWYQGQYWMSV